MSVLTLCKFTPLGFETLNVTIRNIKALSVNLPRWGLKHTDTKKCQKCKECKFTPLGFETNKMYKTIDKG